MTINAKPIRVTETASAKALAQAVGAHDLQDLQRHRPALAAAVTELALVTGNDGLRGQDDPVAVLLRVLARLSMTAPDATSTHAAGLIDALGQGEPASLGQVTVQEPHPHLSPGRRLPSVTLRA